jgi:hypothetical protein
MRHTEIEAQVRKRPFLPFRLRMSDGTAYEVRHPENILVTRTIVALPIYERRSALPERAILCDPIHIIRIEPTNGRGTRKRGRKTR